MRILTQISKKQLFMLDVSYLAVYVVITLVGWRLGQLTTLRYQFEAVSVESELSV